MILSKDDFLALEKEKKIETYRQIRLTKKINDIVDAWDVKSATNLYVLLKRAGIYQDVIKLRDLSYAPHVPVLNPTVPAAQVSLELNDPQPAAYSFIYNLTRDLLNGTELADILERLATYVRLEPNKVRIKLQIQQEDIRA